MLIKTNFFVKLNILWCSSTCYQQHRYIQVVSENNRRYNYLMKYFYILTIFTLLLTGCSRTLYQDCRPTGSLLNPFGSGCSQYMCLTEDGQQAVSTPSRRGICTALCQEEGSLGAEGGICNGRVYLPQK